MFRAEFSSLFLLGLTGHGFSLVKLLCILTVFAIMSWKQLSKVSQKIKRRRSTKNGSEKSE